MLSTCRAEPHKNRRRKVTTEGSVVISTAEVPSPPHDLRERKSWSAREKKKKKHPINLSELSQIRIVEIVSYNIIALI